MNGTDPEERGTTGCLLWMTGVLAGAGVALLFNLPANVSGWRLVAIFAFIVAGIVGGISMLAAVTKN